MNIGLSWPDDNHGGTIFDDAFHTYSVAREWKIYFEIISWILFIVAIIVDWSKRNKQGIRASRICGVLGAIILIASVVAPAVPNYLKATHIDVHTLSLRSNSSQKIVPHCAPQFDNMIQLICLDIVVFHSCV